MVVRARRAVPAPDGSATRRHGEAGGRVRWGRVEVAGESMRPLLAPGDWLLVRYGGRVRDRDVVVARRPDRPGLLLVKRAGRRGDTGWLLYGDNPSASDDSRLFGAVPDELVLGRAVARYWPRPMLLRGRSPAPRATITR